MADKGKLLNFEYSNSHPSCSFSKDVHKMIDYCYEEERIKSFKSWPVHYPVDPVRLAKAGFYYTGYEDEVVCFSCHGCIKNWNYGDVVQKKHSELFPNCDFVNNRSRNVPLIQSKKSDNIGEIKRTNVNNEQSVKLSQIMNTIDYNKMKSLPERLKTFIPNWPLPCIDVSKIAHAGFFYLGFEDKVQCPFCRGIVSNWGTDDDPLKEHIKHFSWCSFLSEISREDCTKKKSWFLNDSEDICGNMKKKEPSELKCRLLDKNQEHLDLKKLGIHLHSSPAHPQQASINARFRSFGSWPDSSPVSKEELAKAGFFYLGIRDHTKCFHCNGGLCNWEPGDDPWIEHARWFRNCGFLRMIKGDSFIELVIRKFHSTQNEFDKHTSCAWSEPLMVKVDEAMKSELVQCILETDVFPPYVVRAAVLRQIKETGYPFHTKDDLCLAASYLKDQMENESLKMDSQQSSDFTMHNIDLKKCAIGPVTENSDVGIKENMLKASPSGVPQLNMKFGDGEKNLAKDHCLCKICMDKEVGVVFLPCGHLLACTECAPALKLCPMCRKTIQATVRAYLP